MFEPPEQQQQRDVLALAVGKALGQWGMVEAHLTRLYARVSDKGIDDAIVSFHNEKLFSTRLKECGKLVCLSEEQYAKRIWAILFRHIMEEYDKRHGIAHFVFKEDMDKIIRLYPLWSFKEHLSGDLRVRFENQG